MTVTYLPQTTAIPSDEIRQNFEYIESYGVFYDTGSVLELSGGGGTRSYMATGGVSLSWVASNISNVATITHGLVDASGNPVTPSVVFTQPHDTGNSSIVPIAQVVAVTSTQFSLQALSTVNSTYSIPYLWLAIG